MSALDNPFKVIRNIIKNPVPALLGAGAAYLSGGTSLLLQGAGAVAGSTLADTLKPETKPTASAVSTPTQANTEDTLGAAINANAQKISQSTFGGLQGSNSLDLLTGGNKRKTLI